MKCGDEIILKLNKDEVGKIVACVYSTLSRASEEEMRKDLIKLLNEIFEQI